MVASLRNVIGEQDAVRSHRVVSRNWPPVPYHDVVRLVGVGPSAMARSEGLPRINPERKLEHTICTSNGGNAQGRGSGPGHQQNTNADVQISRRSSPWH